MLDCSSFFFLLGIFTAKKRTNWFMPSLQLHKSLSDTSFVLIIVISLCHFDRRTSNQWMISISYALVSHLPHCSNIQSQWIEERSISRDWRCPLFQANNHIPNTKLGQVKKLFDPSSTFNFQLVYDLEVMLKLMHDFHFHVIFFPTRSVQATKDVLSSQTTTKSNSRKK